MADGRHVGASAEGRAIARAVVYRFMSCCFAHPDRELLELFDSARLEEFLRSWRYLGFGTSEEIGRITGWQKEFASHDAALRELQKEYTRLFVNACPRVVAPPYSSVYLGGQRRVWGSSTAEVARLYESAGLSMAKDFHDIPDHIAAELEFASYLIVQQCKRADNGTDGADLADIENRFITKHLLRWAPAFLALVIECSRTTFYQVMASLARQFVEQEAKRFSEPRHGTSNSGNTQKLGIPPPSEEQHANHSYD